MSKRRAPSPAKGSVDSAVSSSMTIVPPESHLAASASVQSNSTGSRDLLSVAMDRFPAGRNVVAAARISGVK